MNKFLEKIIESSNNPEQMSMTVTGILVGAVPVLMQVFELMGIGGLTETMGFNIAQQVGVVISGALMLVGMSRKAFNSIVASKK